ncbi:hypothetical protein K040078D81_49630 [Blautia hominis]|uniref:CD-NTase-associated protein 12/Pycsar effector protein TIR domain-containing protein n=1 Tax=Blautia hominis TaxID=2025493 RepID=A0ABQ0BHB8_9FIRM
MLKKDECIYIPASNYFESDLAQIVLEKFRNIVDLGFIKLVSSSNTLERFVKKKRIVYSSLYTKEQIMEKEEEILDKNVPGIWTPREASATADIITNWQNSIDSSEWSNLYKISNYRKITSFEKDVATVPKNLGNRAFVVNHVLPELKINPNNEEDAKEIINKVISRFYIDSFLKEFKAVCYKNFFLIPQANNILPEYFEHIDYSSLCRRLTTISYEGNSLYTYIDMCDNYKLMLLRQKEVLYDALDYKSDTKIISMHMEEIKMKTFIVHGHDGEAKLALKNYIQNTLRMEEPVILSERASGGLTIIEKFEKYSEDCNIIFVLLTPDDLYTEDGKSRARQNVILEMGYFLGKLGRKSGRVILLYKGNLELPNDISGLVYINIDNGIEAAGEEIRREIANI